MLSELEYELDYEEDKWLGEVDQFSLSDIPRYIQQFLRYGSESVAIRLAIARGLRDENKLTNMVFFARHPERRGRRLKRHERRLVREWLDIRNRLVRPALRALSAGRAPTIPPPSAHVRVKFLKPGDGLPKKKTFEAGVGVRKTVSFKSTGDPYDIILGATGAAEGGYDSVNIYDRGILSWGIMQWTVHAGSLQKLLAFIKRRLTDMGSADLWAKLFPGLDVRTVNRRYQLFYRGELKPIEEPHQVPLRLLFRGAAKRGDYDKEIISRWATVFARAGRHPVIQQLQREYARKRIDDVLNKNLGSTLSSFKRRICKKRNKKSLWRWICSQLSRSSEFYRSNYSLIRNYVRNNLKAKTLFFGMWTNNPAAAYVHLKKAIDNLAERYGTYDRTHWPAGWPSALSDRFERVLRASRFGNWGDKKGGTGRTQRILNAFYRLNRQQR